MGKCKWVIGSHKVLERGNLEGKKPVVTFLPRPEWGVFDTNRQAKVALALQLYPELSRYDASNPEHESFLVLHADRWIRNVKGNKILKVSAEGC